MAGPDTFPQVVCFSPCGAYRLVAAGDLGGFDVELKGYDKMGVARRETPTEGEYDPFDTRDTPNADQLLFLEVQRLRGCLERIAEVTR